MNKSEFSRRFGDAYKGCRVVSPTGVLSQNAFHLLSHGHITAEQYTQVRRGEEIRIMEEIREQNSKSILLPKMSEGEEFYVPMSIVEEWQRGREKAIKWSDIIQDCAHFIDDAISQLIPNQIDHVVITSKREKKLNFEFGREPFYSVRIKLIDMKKETAQSIGMRIVIPVSYCVQNNDPRFEEIFQRQVKENMTAVVLTLIHAIKTDSADRIGQEPDGVSPNQPR